MSFGFGFSCFANVTYTYFALQQVTYTDEINAVVPWRDDVDEVCIGSSCEPC